ncbi:MAG: 30S ribosome-binding factor RbfA [Propionibacteriaceae bacterium]|jgi:ribosome-binding factor A|nr:30S ribosome-binding factor RbfA [Propionibacteriaceae bacterium]
MASTASAKVAERIKTVAAEVLQRRVEDPRLGFLTVTDVRLSKDWHAAELFYTVLGPPEAWADAAAALEAARGQVRTAVARAVQLRFAPEIAFVPDAMPEQSAHIEGLFEAVRAADARVAELAQSAAFAGDPDPYKTPGEPASATEDSAIEDEA